MSDQPWTTDPPTVSGWPLVKLREGVIVHVNAIRKAERCGCSTYIELFGDDDFANRLYQIWDEDESLWRRRPARFSPQPGRRHDANAASFAWRAPAGPGSVYRLLELR